MSFLLNLIIAFSHLCWVSPTLFHPTSFCVIFNHFVFCGSAVQWPKKNFGNFMKNNFSRRRLFFYAGTSFLFFEFFLNRKNNFSPKKFLEKIFLTREEFVEKEKYLKFIADEIYVLHEFKGKYSDPINIFNIGE